MSRRIPLPIDARNAIHSYLNHREDDYPALLSRMVVSEVNIATVAELAGHRGINITRRYAKPSEIELEQAVEKVFG
ncbi:hypothetical protein [Shimazuella alba]|uniref:Uncharacterized protein n=1 Tax=Shimazuella alba TaxID=2690964 RepID=A0A6I4VTC7_9BACL|nr:hypothetical protein [Shimazuella alba]MXQ55009.1 hypothetical protein [Shimazuella alba]